MSSRKSKHNKNNSINGKKSEGDYLRQGNDTNNGNEELSAVTFKYPGRFATLTRTILLNESLSTTELLRKVTLDPSQQPPEAKKVFEVYYMDEIFPFINKHAQESINTKKAIEKSWNLQTNHFQKIYVKRSEMLRIKWSAMRSQNKKNKSKIEIHNNNDPSEDQAQASSYNHYSVMNHHHNHSSKSSKWNRERAKKQEPVVEAEPNSTTVIFKYYSVHSSAKTNRHIFITSPTRDELLDKIKLESSSNPPSARELFEVYYYDEILPFLKKSGQQSIRGKKDLAKVWQIQTKTFKGLYEDRCKILTEEWLKLKSTKNGKNKNKRGKNTRHHGKGDKDYKMQPMEAMMITDHDLKAGDGSGNINKWKSRTDSNSVRKISRIECGLIRTLLNFLLFVECTTKQDCFMLCIEDQKEKYIKYNDFKTYFKRAKMRMKLEENLCYLHLRLCIDNFDASCLRLHTGQNIIKLCFINPNDPQEELILFELIWSKIIETLNEVIDHEHIVSSLDEETRILSINVPAMNLK